jgi:hypothetical protein
MMCRNSLSEILAVQLGGCAELDNDIFFEGKQDGNPLL